MSDSVTKYYENIDRWVGDPTVNKVVNEFKERSESGIKKYGTTLHDNDLTTLEWLQHAKEEAMDFALYIQRVMDKIKENAS